MSRSGPFANGQCQDAPSPNFRTGRSQGGAATPPYRKLFFLFFLEEEGGEVGEVAAPDAEAVHAGEFHPSGLDALLGEPVVKIVVGGAQVVGIAAAHPEEAELQVQLVVHVGEGLRVI